MLTSMRGSMTSWVTSDMLGPNGTILLQSVEAAWQLSADRVFDARKSFVVYSGGITDANGWPLQCEDDAVSYHAAQRGIPLYASEPMLSRRVRVSMWHQLRKQKATHAGEMRNIQPFWLGTSATALPVIRIVHQSNEPTNQRAAWHTLDQNGVYTVQYAPISNFNFDGVSSAWSRFDVFVFAPPGWSGFGPTYYDDGHLFDGGQFYDGLNGDNISDIVAGILDWKSAHSWLRSVWWVTLAAGSAIPDLVTGSGVVLDPEGTPQALLSGAMSLPTGAGAGNWAMVTDPATGLPTRPDWLSLLYYAPLP